MQVLHWLFKLAQDQQQEQADHISKLENKASKEVKESTKKIVSYKHKRVCRKAQNPEETSLDCKNFRYLALLLRRGSSAKYFSSTIDNKIRLGSLDPRQKEQHYYILSMKLKEELIRSLGKNDRKVEVLSSAHVGNKVLPISDSVSSSSSSSSSNSDEQKQCQPFDQKKDRSNYKGESNRNKTLSRMKELLRWAATAKSEKSGKFARKILHFRNKSATIKARGFDEELSNESPKISLKWEVESCNTSCSVASAPPSMKYDECCHRTGNWITTDDEFVVLEL